MSRDRCRNGCHYCFGYQGDYDNFACLCPCHDARTEDDGGRQLCQAHDKRWADIGYSTCRFHRLYDPSVYAKTERPD